MTIDKIHIGDKASIKHKITDKDIEQFVDLTGDNNKLHVNEEYARKTEFKHPVVHGMLGASFISTVIGTKLPGDGALWYAQTLEFLRPARVGDTITVTGEVIGKNDSTKTVEIKTEILNQHKQVITTGVARVKLVELQKAPEIIQTGTDEKSERVVIILGATGGIGQAAALKLASEGYHLVLHYNTNKKLAVSIREAVQKTGRKAIAVQADLLDPSAVGSFMEAVNREFTSIYGFVNCSSVKIPSVKFTDLEWSYLQDHLDINIKCSFHILKEILPKMEVQKFGKIVFITTQAIETPNSEWLHYITAKSALHGFAKALAIEYAPKGIQVNMVSPGMTDTDLLSEVPQKIKLLSAAKTPLRRLCTPGDVANSIAFLLSDSANFITGETIRVNGGQVMI